MAGAVGDSKTESRLSSLAASLLEDFRAGFGIKEASADSPHQHENPARLWRAKSRGNSSAQKEKDHAVARSLHVAAHTIGNGGK
jgi:hypothetical protein